MLMNKAYKRMLAASVLATVMGTGSVWAANVQTGYTPEMGTVATNSAADKDDTSIKAAVYNTDKTKDQADAEAAIRAARGDTTISEDGRVVQGSDGTVIVNTGALTTDDSQVKMISRTTADTDLDAARVSGQSQATISEVQAQYVSSATEETLKPYIGKTITGLGIEGVDANNQQQLLGVLTEKIGDTLTVDGVLKDIQSLGNTGVFSEITPTIVNVPEGVKVNYQLTVNPIAKGVQFEGNTVYSSEMLTNYMAIQPGAVLNTVYIGQKIQGINSAYSRDGYMLAHVNGIRVDESGIVHIFIVEGKVEKIVPAGNKKTRDKVITREFVQKAGKPFNKFLVRRSVERVYNLGFFDDVNVRMLPGTTDNDVIVEIDVLEHKTGTVTLGAGYSDSDGVVGIIEFGEDNFRGTGDKFKVHWEIGGKDNYKNYQISYLKPWIDSKGTSLGFTYFNRNDSNTDYNENGDEVAEYNKKSKGFNISFGRQTGEYTRDYLTLETRKDDYEWDDDDSSGYRYDKNSGSGTNWNNGSYNFANDDYIKNNFGRINSATWQKVYDSRDNVYDPTRGKRISYTAQWAGHGLGGDFDFYKFTAETRMYRKVGSNYVLAFRGRVGWVQGDAPYSQLFTLGGADSLRGYEDNQFRGKKMYNATLEFRFPVVKKVTGVLFADIGDAWDAPNVTWYNSKKSFNVGIGAGVRVSTPIGPVRLDYGVGENENKFHFSFGTQF